MKVMFFASSLTASSTCTAVIHDMITRDRECPSHYYYIICSYDVTAADFKNSPYAFGQSEKREQLECIIIAVIMFSVNYNFLLAAASLM